MGWNSVEKCNAPAGASHCHWDCSAIGESLLFPSLGISGIYGIEPYEVDYSVTEQGWIQSRNPGIAGEIPIEPHIIRGVVLVGAWEILD